MLILHIILLLITFYLLAVITEDFFVPSLDQISKKLKLSSEAAGATLMAAGSSAPEFFTAFFAVMRPDGIAEIGAGTIVGSAIFNILVIVGASAMFRQAQLTWQVALRDMGFYILSIIALLIVFMDGKVVISEAFFFVVLYVIYVSAAVNWKKWFNLKEKNTREVVVEAAKRNPITGAVYKSVKFFIPDAKGRFPTYVVAFILSILVIAFLSHTLVESAVAVGSILNINHAIIALTVLAAGTSIPDLLSSIAVAKQGRGDMAISNAVGSNIFDILFALGFPWLLVMSLGRKEIYVGTENLMSSIFLLFATVVALLFILLVKNWRLGERAGIILIVMYLGYLAFNVYQISAF